MKKRLVAAIASCFVLLLAGVVVCNVWTTRNAAGRTFDSFDDVPSQQVALLLGTSPKNLDGTTNVYFVHRMNAMARLYKSGKVRRILVSGDDNNREYNEPQEMRDSLLTRGVPDSVMVLDPYGYRTLDSVVRALKVFGFSEVVFVSQRFHNERALFLADHFGLKAVGYNAEDATGSQHWKNELREWLARPKMFLDFATNKQPRVMAVAPH